MTSSSSCKNFRVMPSPSSTVRVPRQLNSSMEPKESVVGPLIVPDPKRSPGWRLQPVIVWCANCCFMVQYMYLKFDRLTTASFSDPPALMP